MARRYTASDKVPNVPNGCKLHDDCFTCPFPDCVWQHGENFTAQPQTDMPSRRAKARAMRANGRKVVEIAGVLGVTKATVYTYLRTTVTKGG